MDRNTRITRVEALHEQIEVLKNAWPVIEADELVKCERCGEVAEPDMAPTLEPHGETTLTPRCVHCGSEWIHNWPAE